MSLSLTMSKFCFILFQFSLLCHSTTKCDLSQQICFLCAGEKNTNKKHRWDKGWFFSKRHSTRLSCHLNNKYQRWSFMLFKLMKHHHEISNKNLTCTDLGLVNLDERSQNTISLLVHDRKLPFFKWNHC